MFVHFDVIYQIGVSIFLMMMIMIRVRRQAKKETNGSRLSPMKLFGQPSTA